MADVTEQVRSAMDQLQRPDRGEDQVQKVGPKGYIHGWIYVGPQAPGGRVFDTRHGHGTITAHEVEPGKKVRGGVHVEFDSGHRESYRARFKDTSKPRLYGPVDPDTKVEPPHVPEMDNPDKLQPRPKNKPIKPKSPPADPYAPKAPVGLEYRGMQVWAGGRRIGLVFGPNENGKFSHQGNDGGASEYKFESFDLAALALRAQHNSKPMRSGDLTLNDSGFAINRNGKTIGEIDRRGTLDRPQYRYQHFSGQNPDNEFSDRHDALDALYEYHQEYQRAEEAEKERKRAEHEYAKQVEDKHIFAPRREQYTHTQSRRITDEKRAKIQARRKRIVDLYGAGLKIHNSPHEEPVVDKHMKEFFSIPESHHKVIAARGYDINIGKGSVADYQPHLADVHPQGYAPGLTWKDSAGAHNGGDEKPWMVFGNTVEHGSHAMVVHEMGHGMDASLGKRFGADYLSDQRSSPWGAGFRSYFDGLTDYDAESEKRWEKAQGDWADAQQAWYDRRPAGMDVEEYTNEYGWRMPSQPPMSPPVRLLPYYRPSHHGGHDYGAREMFAEAYSAYVTSKPADRAEAITRTLHGGVYHGDPHVGTMLTEYFDDMVEWMEANT